MSEKPGVGQRLTTVWDFVPISIACPEVGTKSQNIYQGKKLLGFCPNPLNNLLLVSVVLFLLVVMGAGGSV